MGLVGGVAAMLIVDLPPISGQEDRSHGSFCRISKVVDDQRPRGLREVGSGLPSWPTVSKGETIGKGSGGRADPREWKGRLVVLYQPPPNGLVLRGEHMASGRTGQGLTAGQGSRLSSAYLRFPSGGRQRCTTSLRRALSCPMAPGLAWWLLRVCAQRKFPRSRSPWAVQRPAVSSLRPPAANQSRGDMEAPPNSSSLSAWAVLDPCVVGLG